VTSVALLRWSTRDKCESRSHEHKNASRNHVHNSNASRNRVQNTNTKHDVRATMTYAVQTVSHDDVRSTRGDCDGMPSMHVQLRWDVKHKCGVAMTHGDLLFDGLTAMESSSLLIVPVTTALKARTRARVQPTASTSACQRHST
jgi:aminoglycoside phosphotransferase family enzyme